MDTESTPVDTQRLQTDNSSASDATSASNVAAGAPAEGMTSAIKRNSLTRRAISGAESLRNRLKQSKSDDVNKVSTSDTTDVDDTHDVSKHKQHSDTSVTSPPCDSPMEQTTSNDSSVQSSIKPTLTKQASVDDDGGAGGARRTSTLRRATSDDGINDSITNFSIFTNAMYNLTCTVSRWVWVFLRTSVAFIYNTVTTSQRKTDQSAIDGKISPTKQATDGDQQPTEAVEPVDEARERRLYNIANELMTTEEQYVKRLGVLVVLKAETSSILQPDVAKAMFQNIEVIHQFHHDNLLPELRERLDNWESTKRVGDIMKKLTPFLKLYTQYVKNYETANNLLITWRHKSSAFSKLMTDAEQNSAYGRLKVQAHMLEPVQRVPRYELLLRDYLRKLPASSPDREDSERALHLVSQAASHFEEMMERDSRLLELMKLQDQFDGGGVSIVNADRELVHKDKVKVISLKSGKVSEKVIHLFNDLLLVSSESWNITGGDKYKAKYHFNLNHTKVGFGLNLEVNNVFFVSSRGTVLELIASNADERVDWISRIDHEIQACAKKNNFTPVPTPERSYDCDACLRKQQLLVSSDAGKSWKRRTLVLYENGLLAAFKHNSDKQALSVVYLSDFTVSLASIPQKKGTVCTLEGEGKTYHLHDDNKALVETFYNAICPFQANISSDDDVISREYVTLRHHAPGAADSQSVDSGIDLQSSVRVSSASMDSDVSALSRASLQSADSTVECGITEAMLAASQSENQQSEPAQPTGGVTSPDKDICDDEAPNKTPTETTKSTEV